MGKQQHIPNRTGVGKKHHQPVDAYPLPRCRRQAVLQGTHVIVIIVHGLFITGIFLCHLGQETLRLVFRVIQLGKTVGQLTTADKKFKAVRDKWISVTTTRQR